MENSIVTFICSKALWIPIICSFIMGVIVKYFVNKLTTPKITISKEILYDHKTGKPYVQVKNKSHFRWSAYDLHFYLTYLKNDVPIHTGIIHNGVLKGGLSEKYSISPKKDIDYDAYSPDCKLEIILIFRNRFSTYSIIEQKCAVDTSVVRTNT